MWSSQIASTNQFGQWMGSIETAFVLEILKLDSVFTVMGYFPDASELLPIPIQ